MIPPLPVQTLVENSVKHAIAPRPSGGRIRVDASRARRPARALGVWDDGPGFSRDRDRARPRPRESQGAPGRALRRRRRRSRSRRRDGGTLVTVAMPRTAHDWRDGEPPAPRVPHRRRAAGAQAAGPDARRRPAASRSWVGHRSPARAASRSPRSRRRRAVPRHHTCPGSAASRSSSGCPPVRAWSSRPRTTSTRCRHSRRMRSTICSSPSSRPAGPHARPCREPARANAGDAGLEARSNASPAELRAVRVPRAPGLTGRRAGPADSGRPGHPRRSPATARPTR